MDAAIPPKYINEVTAWQAHSRSGSRQHSKNETELLKLNDTSSDSVLETVPGSYCLQ